MAKANLRTTSCRVPNADVRALEGAIPGPLLTVLVFWISPLFLGFGLFWRYNATVTVALLVGALSVAGVIDLILELNDPFRGLLRTSDEPLRNAIAQIDQ